MVVLLSVNYLKFLTDDEIILFFSTFGFCWFSRTFYIKWVCCSCRMVVLLSVKYFNILVDDMIILFFVQLDFIGLIVFPILSDCTSQGKCVLYFWEHFKMGEFSQMIYFSYFRVV
jgi:hypothetical protein